MILFGDQIKDLGLELIGFSNATQVLLTVNVHGMLREEKQTTFYRSFLQKYGQISNRCVCIKVAGLIVTLRSSFHKGLTFLHETVTKLIAKISLNSQLNRSILQQQNFSQSICASWLNSRLLSLSLQNYFIIRTVVSFFQPSKVCTIVAVVCLKVNGA